MEVVVMKYEDRERICIYVTLEQKEEIMAYARSHGESMNSLFLRLIEEDMNRKKGE
jgi:hypothetical protein